MTLTNYFPNTHDALQRLREALKTHRQERSMTRYRKAVRRAMSRVPTHLSWEKRAKAMSALMEANYLIFTRIQ
jgi:hypothetical protein